MCFDYDYGTFILSSGPLSIIHLQTCTDFWKNKKRNIQFTLISGCFNSCFYVAEMAVFGFIATTLICFTLLSLPGTLPEEGQCLGSPNCCFLLKMCRQPFALKQHKKNKRGCVKLITMLKCTMTLYSIYI